jgi:monoamine oxidase
MPDVLVVGAGLAGLTAADDLAASGVSVAVVEARSRVGGRIMTVPAEGTAGWLDLGATWHWADQAAVVGLAAELGLATFGQFDAGLGLVEEAEDDARAVEVPPPPASELRFVGGTQPLCQRLADRLPAGSVSLGQDVRAVAGDGSGVALTVAGADGSESTLSASFVVVAVPPRLALQGIDFAPALPGDVVDAMEATGTWMADAVKCVVVYDTAFWREAGRSGFAYSHVGPLREVHDACTDGASTDDVSVAALFGFLAPDDGYRLMEPAERAELVLGHLERLFGPGAADPVQYLERDWSNDPYTKEQPRAFLGELADYGHPAFTRPLLGGRLVWAGAETEAVGGGHMEAAVRSGRRAAALVRSAMGLRGPNAVDTGLRGPNAVDMGLRGPNAVDMGLRGPNAV